MAKVQTNLSFEYEYIFVTIDLEGVLFALEGLYDSFDSCVWT
jgi:hypothetical protein